MTKVFTNIPFFRIILPFIIGIILSIQFNFKPIHFIFLGVIIIAAFSIKTIKVQSILTKRVYLICLDIFFFLLAINLVSFTNTSNKTNYYGNYLKQDSVNYFIAVVNDVPTKKEKFIKCELKIKELKTNDGYKSVNGTIIGYFKKTGLDNNLKVGATVVLKAKLLDAVAPQNPFEFDYKNYLYNKQIYHTAFIDNGSYEILNVPVQLNTIWYYGLLIKQSILKKLKNSNLSSAAFGICAALLTGYDDEIDKQVIESFSHSGTLHVLSVSGLHTGLIYLVLSFLFDLIDKKRRYKILKFSIITILLWCFALITGFSAPVLRAVIMFNLLGFGRIFYRSDSRNQINILLVSAFILLCYNPFFITDVGFLLSYFAMFGLLYFQPKLVKLWSPDSRVINWLWQGTTTSFAATISTLPLTLFYFKQFPFWFFVCNIIVIPASFIILLLALLIVFKIGFAAIVVNYIANWLISFITFFNSNKFGFIDAIHFQLSDAIFLSILIIVISLVIQSKSYRQLTVSFVILICWQLSALTFSYDSKTESFLTVYQINKNNAVVVKNKTTSIINNMDSSQYNYHVKPHVISFNNSDIMVKKINYVSNDNKSILLLDKIGFWPNILYRKIDYLILANNFRLSKEDLSEFTNVKTIILDGSNNHQSAKHAEELCRKFGIELIATKQKGAYILNL